MLALLDCPDFGDAVVYSCNCEIQQKVAGGPGGKAFNEKYFREAAGHGFFQRYERTERSNSSEDGDDSDDDERTPSKERSKKRESVIKGGGILKLSELLKGEKLYKLLDVAEGASQDDIKKAYRDAALRCHPDKMGQVSEAEKKKVEENFVKIQEAHEILSDPAKRQLYDSSLDFDESVPKFKDGKSDEEFYEEFGECFRRNARFSAKKPVPELGDSNTSMNDVKKFYDFWYSFSSWRDPLAMAQANDEDLQDLDDAECREEKRWMIRENQRVAKHYKKAEQERIADLVSMAEKYDPRVRAEKEAKKAARAAEAARKEEERMAVVRAKQEKERIQREAEEAAAAIEAEKRRQEKAIKEAAKAEVKKLRQRLRALHPQMSRFVMLDQLNEVCIQFEAAALESLGEDVAAKLAKGESGIDAAVQLVYAAIETLGLKPIVPDEANGSTTSGGGDATENDVSFEVELTPEEMAAKEKKRQEQQAKREAEEAEKAVERAKAAEKAAEQRKIREEQKKKEEAAAVAKQKQQEKKDAEKAKKEEKKAIKAKEDAEALKIKQREEAQRKSEEQKLKDQQMNSAEKAEREEQRIMKLFDDDRLERLALFEKAKEEDLLNELSAACEADASLNGAMYLLKKAAPSYQDDEQSLDCAAVLLKSRGGVWPLAMTNPKDVKPVPQTRNKCKKVRGQLRLIMQKFLDSRKATEGADAEKDATDYQKGMVDGLFEWPVWTAEEREKELAERAAAKDNAKAAKGEEAAQGEAAEPAATGKKGKKAAAAKGKGGEEDLDGLLAEFGVTVDDSKKKKKKGKN